MIERGIPRQGYILTTNNGTPIGQVTSGTSSPTLGVGIGMGYIEYDYSKVGTEINVLIRDKNIKASIVHLPFI